MSADHIYKCFNLLLNFRYHGPCVDLEYFHSIIFRCKYTLHFSVRWFIFNSLSVIFLNLVYLFFQFLNLICLDFLRILVHVVLLFFSVQSLWLFQLKFLLVYFTDFNCSWEKLFFDQICSVILVESGFILENVYNSAVLHPIVFVSDLVILYQSRNIILS